jgi:hypothetical protein
MVLAVAAIILAITTQRDFAAPSTSLIYRPELPLLY